MIHSIRVLVFYSFLMMVLISCVENEGKIVYKNEVSVFENIEYKEVNDILKWNHSFKYEGSEDFPLYSADSFLSFNDHYYMLDNVAHRVIEVNDEGLLVKYWGREGSGPGEFLSAEKFISGSDSLIYVLDGQGNFKIHAFTKDGDDLFAFPLRSYGPFTDSHLIKKDEKKVFLTTTNTNCKDHADKSCILQIQDSEGNIINSFGEINQIQPNYVGVSFYSTVIEDKIYVIHFLGNAITVYDLHGNYEHHIALQRSPHITLPDIANFPSDVYQQVTKLNESSYTSITGLFSNCNYIIVQYLRNGDEYKDYGTRYFLDFYDVEGSPIYRGVNIEYPLKQTEEKKFYFVGYNADAQYGSVIVDEFIYNNHNLYAY